MLLREQAARARSMAAKKLRRGPEAGAFPFQLELHFLGPRLILSPFRLGAGIREGAVVVRYWA